MLDEYSCAIIITDKVRGGGVKYSMHTFYIARHAKVKS